MFKSIVMAVCVMASGFTNVVIAEEAVLCRNLQITYDTAKLEEELKIVENCYMPRFLDDKSGTWTAIPLRNATGTDSQEGLELNNTLIGNNMLPCKNSPFLQQLPYMSSILEDIAIIFNTEVGLVRLSNIHSQKKLFPHRDGEVFDLNLGMIYRLHIPIITDENVIFKINRKSYRLEAGVLYYTNVSKLHSVENNGSFDRIHLVIDVHANDILREYILQSPEVDPILPNQ